MTMRDRILAYLLPDGDWRPSLAIAVLLGLTLLYLPYFRSDSVFYGPDLYPFFFVGQKYWWETFARDGSFPLWNPYFDLGTGMLYNPNRGLFYPFHLLQFFFTPLFLYRFGFVAHLVLFAWGVRRWGQAAGATARTQVLVAALAVTAPLVNAFSVSTFIYLYAFTWSVWILSELELRLTDRMKAWRLLLFWAILVSNGEPFSTLVVGIVVGGTLLLEKRWRLLAGFLAAGVAVSVVVYGHALVALPYFTRGRGFDVDTALSFSLHPFRLLTLLSPYFFGHPTHGTFDAMAAVNDSPYAARFFFDTLYLPLPLLLAASLGVARAWRERRWPAIAFLATGLLLAFGKWGLLRFLYKIPPFSILRYPEKMICITSLLFVYFALRPDTSTEEWRKSRLVAVLLIAAVALPFLAKSPDWPVAFLALGLAACVWLRGNGAISSEALWMAALVIGLLQNRLAFPPQRYLPADRVATRSPMAEAIFARIPAGSFSRFEVTPSLFENGFPHEYLLWGSGMADRRASLFGYESFDTPFTSTVKDLLYGKNEAIAPKTMQAIVQLTNLRLIAVRPDRPVASLLAAVNAKKPLLKVGPSGDNWLFLEPVTAPHALWWFPQLDATPAGDEALLAWPPNVDKSRLPSAAECAEKRDAAALPETSLRKLDENHIAIELEAPCDGWVFLSQHLLPGWSLTTSDGDIPLVAMNRTFVGFPVRKGALRAELRYRPWRALLP